VHQSHGFLPAGCRRDDRCTVGVLLTVPLGERLVVPTFAWMEQTSRRRCTRWRRLAVSIDV